MPSSIHSGISGRSIGSFTSTLTSRSKKSVAASQKIKLKWWQRRPILKTAYFLDLQKGSYLAAIYTLVQSILLLILCLFDLYCLYEARPGSKHFRSFGFSFLFVYSGNRYVRYALMAISSLLVINAIVLLFTSITILPALRKEYEVKFRPWILTMFVYTIFRALTIILQSIANDLYFSYHQAMLIIWGIITPLNVFAWLVVYSNYQELSDITKIEDVAKLKMSTLSSIHGSRSLSQMSHQSLNSYGNYGATINANPSPSYMRSAHNISHQSYGPTSSALYGNLGGSNLYVSATNTPNASVLGHHASTPSLKGGAAYTIPLEMFNLNRPSSIASSNQRINQEFI